MKRSDLPLLLPMILVFILLKTFFIAGKTMLTKWGIDQSVVIIGSVLLFLLSFISFTLSRRSLRSDNPNVFVRAMYANFMIKLFVCAGVALIYFMSARKNINKPGLFVCMALYIVYTVLEVSSLTKLLRKKKNA